MNNLIVRQIEMLLRLVAFGEAVNKALRTADQLYGIVPNKLAGNYPLQKEWDSARHLERVTASKRTPDTPRRSSLPYTRYDAPGRASKSRYRSDPRSRQLPTNKSSAQPVGIASAESGTCSASIS